jgi:hypothetical protein
MVSATSVLPPAYAYLSSAITAATNRAEIALRPDPGAQPKTIGSHGPDVKSPRRIPLQESMAGQNQSPASAEPSPAGGGPTLRGNRPTLNCSSSPTATRRRDADSFAGEFFEAMDWVGINYAETHRRDRAVCRSAANAISGEGCDRDVGNFARRPPVWLLHSWGHSDCREPSTRHRLDGGPLTASVASMSPTRAAGEG